MSLLYKVVLHEEKEIDCDFADFLVTLLTIEQTKLRNNNSINSIE